jgi:cytoskeletal protein RodZ
VATFGKNLREAREARNMTLQEIAASTKISTRALQALEDEHFDLLPGGVFNKGFVRAYARCVGLDEEKTISEYLEAAQMPVPEIDMRAMSSQVSAARDAARRPSSGISAPTFAGIVAIIVALAMGALWFKEQRKNAREQAAIQQRAENAASPAASNSTLPKVAESEPNPASQSTSQGAASNPVQNSAPNAAQDASQSVSPSTNQAAPVGSTGSEAVESKAAMAPVEVSISAIARAWVSISSDGTKVETLTMDPEKPEVSTRNYKAREKLVLTVGNPAGLSVTFNGKPTGSLGMVGHPTTITFTPQGMEKE